MRGETSAGPSFDLAAVGAGILWALLFLLVGAMAQGVYDYLSPLTAGAREAATIVWQSLAALVAGLIAGRRAQGAGWLHGGVAGVGLALAGAVVVGVLTAFPAAVALLKAMGAGGALGAIAGVAGVNLR